jgi:hypothetical protein
MSELTPAPKSARNPSPGSSSSGSRRRRQTAAAVNIGLTLLYWRLGDRIRREVLGFERAAYGEQIVATVSHELATEFGRGFERTNLTRMMKFAEAFPDEEIVATLSQQLSWSHFRELLPLDKPLQREFYAEIAAWKAGASGLFGTASTPCSMSEQQCRESPRNWPGRSSQH